MSYRRLLQTVDAVGVSTPIFLCVVRHQKTIENSFGTTTPATFSRHVHGDAIVESRTVVESRTDDADRTNDRAFCIFDARARGEFSSGRRVAENCIEDGVDTAHPIMHAGAGDVGVRQAFSLPRRCIDRLHAEKRFPADALFGRLMMEDHRMQFAVALWRAKRSHRQWSATVIETHLHDSSSS